MKKQIEIKWTEPEPFALISQVTTDGDVIARERDKTVADRKESDERQAQIETYQEVRPAGSCPNEVP